MIKNLNVENGLVEIEHVSGTAIEIAADLACVVDAIFSEITNDEKISKEVIGELFIEAVKMAVNGEPSKNGEEKEKKSDDPTDAAFMAFLNMLMSDDKRPVS